MIEILRFFQFFLQGEDAGLNRTAFLVIIIALLVLIVNLVLPPLIKWLGNRFDFNDWVEDRYWVKTIANFFDRLASKLVNIGPGWLTTTGIFFTFLGITIGLKDFDPSSEDLRKNVVELLDGMKLAFFSSVVAIGASIIF